MRLSEMLAGQPPALTIAGVRPDIRDKLVESGKHLVVIDDDPACSQAVTDVPVYLDWSQDTLQRALSSEYPVFSISTNSRNMSPEDATRLAQELGRNLSEAATRSGIDVLIASQSDSALCGHYPCEIDALAQGLDREFDGVIIAPASFEEGRYTIDDIQWTVQDDEMISLDRTELARDPVFGYRNGNLRQWVEEKTAGVVHADQVRSISLKTIRNGGPVAVEDELLNASNGQPIIVNAACYEDLEVFVLGLMAAESQGKHFIYRCGPSFVKARGGFQDRPFLTFEQIRPGNAPGLLVAGSYVDTTSRQLQALIKSKLAVGVELRVDALLRDETVDAEITRAAAAVNERLAGGDSTALYTSRTRHSISSSSFLKLGQTIMTSLCKVIREIDVQPGFLIAKGANTTMEVARSLGLKEALAVGQAIQGVPVWRLGQDTPWPDIPYVVFPGSVGGENALVDVFVRCDSARRILHLR